MLTMTEQYQKYLTVVGLVLTGLDRGRTIPGEVLHEWVLHRGREIRDLDKSYGFDRWSGAPFWEFIQALASSGFVSPEAGRPRDAQEWSQSGLRLTARGRRVLAEILSTVPESHSLLSEAAVEPRSATA
jgi:hypothetical protein